MMRRTRGCVTVLVTLAGVVLLSGCQELVHMGQISDREAAFAVGNARIDQQQRDGTWKSLGATDGNGKWWIMKEKVKGGGRVRITKPGYFPVYMTDSQFLQEVNIMMIPSGGAGATDAVGEPWSDDANESPQDQQGW